MMQDSNPYAAILRAGKMRLDATRLEEEAEVIEGNARMQLRKEDIELDVVIQNPGSMLGGAFGGPCAGTVTNVPMETFAKLMLVERNGSAMHEYEPAMLVRLGAFMACGVMVPKGKVHTFYDAMRQRDHALHALMAQLLVRSAGFNSRMVRTIVDSAERSAGLNSEAPNTPLFVQLGAMP